MNNLITSLLLGLVLLATGCSSMNPPDAYYHAQMFRVTTQAQLAKEPLVTMNCESACNVSVRDPGAVAAIDKVSQGTTSADVAKVAITEGAGLLKFGLGAAAAVKVVKEIGDRSYEINGDGNQIQQDYRETAVSNSSADTEIAAEGNIGISGDANVQEVDSSQVATTDQSITGSYNPIDNSSQPIDNSVNDSNNPIDSNDDNSTQLVPVSEVSGVGDGS